jgi:MFS family permease
MSNRTPTIAFISREWRFLMFGALIMFWTSPGQTYLISLFGDQFRQGFNLSHGDFGSLYTLATISSAAILWPAGRLVDKLQLTKFVWWVCVAMVMGTISMSFVNGPVSLFFGILFVRFLGQGMMSHIAVTAMARRYVDERGRAIAIAGFGFPIGEGIFPPLITIGLTITGWQNIWVGMGIAAAIMLLPTVPFLLKRTTGQDGQGQKAPAVTNKNQRQWTRSEVLCDHKFFMIAPLIMTMSALFTGIIFHQKYIITTLKEWDFFWWSICFSGFAVSQIIGSFSAGWLVDRISARLIAPFILLPFAGSLIILALSESAYWALGVLALMGLSAGSSNPTFSSLWAELYGTEHLGSIRSAGAVLSVFASALGPVFVGLALDEKASMMIISSISVAITLSTCGLAAIGLRR